MPAPAAAEKGGSCPLAPVDEWGRPGLAPRRVAAPSPSYPAAQSQRLQAPSPPASSLRPLAAPQNRPASSLCLPASPLRLLASPLRLLAPQRQASGLPPAGAVSWPATRRRGLQTGVSARVRARAFPGFFCRGSQPLTTLLWQGGVMDNPQCTRTSPRWNQRDPVSPSSRRGHGRCYDMVLANPAFPVVAQCEICTRLAPTCTNFYSN